MGLETTDLETAAAPDADQDPAANVPTKARRKAFTREGFLLIAGAGLLAAVVFLGGLAYFLNDALDAVDEPYPFVEIDPQVDATLERVADLAPMRDGEAPNGIYELNAAALALLAARWIAPDPDAEERAIGAVRAGATPNAATVASMVTRYADLYSQVHRAVTRPILSVTQRYAWDPYGAAGADESHESRLDLVDLTDVGCVLVHHAAMTGDGAGALTLLTDLLIALTAGCVGGEEYGRLFFTEYGQRLCEFAWRYLPLIQASTAAFRAAAARLEDRLGRLEPVSHALARQYARRALLYYRDRVGSTAAEETHLLDPGERLAHFQQSVATRRLNSDVAIAAAYLDAPTDSYPAFHAWEVQTLSGVINDVHERWNFFTLALTLPERLAYRVRSWFGARLFAEGFCLMLRLEGFQRETGRFPDRLGDLPDASLFDAVSGQPLRYSRNADFDPDADHASDAYRLYSIGFDGADDDGTWYGWDYLLGQPDVPLLRGGPPPPQTQPADADAPQPD